MEYDVEHLTAMHRGSKTGLCLCNQSAVLHRNLLRPFDFAYVLPSSFEFLTPSVLVVHPVLAELSAGVLFSHVFVDQDLQRVLGAHRRRKA